jgi:hypothetical protein
MAWSVQTWWNIFGNHPERRKKFAEALKEEGICEAPRWLNGWPVGIPREYEDRAEQLALLVKWGSHESTDNKITDSEEDEDDATPLPKRKRGRPRKKKG